MEHFVKNIPPAFSSSMDTDIQTKQAFKMQTAGESYQTLNTVIFFFSGTYH